MQYEKGDIQSSGYHSRGPSYGDEADAEWDGFISPLSDESEDNLEHMLCMKRDETTSIDAINTLKNVLAHEKSRDLEVIRNQQEQINLLWNELEKNHKVIEQLLEQNSMSQALLCRNNGFVQTQQGNIEPSFSKSTAMNQASPVDNQVVPVNENCQENRLVTVIIVYIGARHREAAGHRCFIRKRLL